MSKPQHPGPDNGYRREVACRAVREQVFAAVATLDGLRGWWTPIVAGTSRVGNLLSFGFEGLDEAIVMRVDELAAPSRVRWLCLQHTSCPDWAGTSIFMQLDDSGPGQCVLTFTHTGLPAHDVASGWDRFLASLTCLVQTGQGQPYRTAPGEALELARDYHAAWTSKDFAAAHRYLAPDLQTDVPINCYTGPDDFADALASFGALAEQVDLLAEFGAGDQAVLLYDVHTTTPVGTLRIAEHFTVQGGLIRCIRHVHDTAALRHAA